MACKRSGVQVPYPPFSAEPKIESRQEKVESRRIRALEIFQGQEAYITVQLFSSSTFYSLLSFLWASIEFDSGETR